jgi:hypothetical protein
LRHKRFRWGCPRCRQTGLEPDRLAVYKVRVCTVCEGSGRLRITVAQRLDLDLPRPMANSLRGGGLESDVRGVDAGRGGDEPRRASGPGEDQAGQGLEAEGDAAQADQQNEEDRLSLAERAIAAGGD